MLYILVGFLVVRVEEEIPVTQTRVMGHSWLASEAGAPQLIRVEVDLTKNMISFYRLRR